MREPTRPIPQEDHEKAPKVRNKNGISGALPDGNFVIFALSFYSKRISAVIPAPNTAAVPSRTSQ